MYHYNILQSRELGTKYSYFIPIERLMVSILFFSSFCGTFCFLCIHVGAPRPETCNGSRDCDNSWISSFPFFRLLFASSNNVPKFDHQDERAFAASIYTPRCIFAIPQNSCMHFTIFHHTSCYWPLG